MWRRRVLVAALATASLLLSVPIIGARAAPAPGAAGAARIDHPSPAFGLAATAFTGCGGLLVQPINAGFEQQVVGLINAQRAAQPSPLPPLTISPGLSYAARYHAADMAQDDYFDHETKDRVNGQLVPVCAWNERIAHYYAGAAALGENIAAGQATPADVVSTWMASPDHRANILNPDFTKTGVGYYTGGSFGSYWVQDFGRGGEDLVGDQPLNHQFLPLVVNHP